MKKIYLLIIVLIVIAFFSVIWLFYPRVKELPPTPKPVQKHQYAYKINVDSLVVVYGKVGNNQNLGSILNNYVSGQMIDRIAKETDNVFDVRKIHPDRKFARIVSKDAAPRTLYFIYEINDVDYVVYDFRDTLRVYVDKKRVVVKTRTATGIISTSLWNTFEDNNLDVNLGMKLSDIYAWTIDFYGLQKGDHFKLLYEELYVDSTYIGTDRVLAAEFTSNGRDFYAYYFSKDTIHGYFDEKGQSLRRSFLKAPLKFSRISSRYSKARMHPVLRIVRPHFGVDYAAPRGTPVVALGNGRIAEAGWKGGYGRFISIRHNSVYTSTYAYLSGYAKGINAGSFVNQGDLIGYVGMSGLATGPHLDFRVYKNGSPVDPLKMESPPALPVGKTYMQTYNQLVVQMKTKLDSIDH
ncbi:MAG: M23 family metallopeptidase [Bacteroidetes bacterium]|nr:M23 family metallopeptidase [Bacteroidota bacterium]